MRTSNNKCFRFYIRKKKCRSYVNSYTCKIHDSVRQETRESNHCQISATNFYKLNIKTNNLCVYIPSTFLKKQKKKTSKQIRFVDKKITSKILKTIKLGYDTYQVSWRIHCIARTRLKYSCIQKLYT